MIEQDNLNKFYSQMNDRPEYAEARLRQYQYSGLTLIDKILPNESVIDIGCGCNIFKKYLPNVVGIDPVYAEADYMTTLEDFTTDKKFNVAFCLGTIQYGTLDDVKNQISKVIQLLTPKARIYWRSKMANPSAPPKTYDFTIYRWTIESHYELAELFGFTVKEYAVDILTNDPTNRRLYAEWIR
jgi:hypothetical protein